MYFHVKKTSSKPIKILKIATTLTVEHVLDLLSVPIAPILSDCQGMTSSAKGMDISRPCQLEDVFLAK